MARHWNAILFEVDRIVIPDPDTLLAIGEALEKLAADDAAAAEVARLRLFAGLSVDDAADAIVFHGRLHFATGYA